MTEPEKKQSSSVKTEKVNRPKDDSKHKYHGFYSGHPIAGGPANCYLCKQNANHCRCR